MDEISKEFLRAAGGLLTVGGAIVVWRVARELARGGKLLYVLLAGVACCAGIALIVALTLGDPTCDEADEYGSCIARAEDGFEPTTEDRLVAFVYPFTMLLPPVMLGVVSGSKLPRGRNDEYR